MIDPVKDDELLVELDDELFEALSRQAAKNGRPVEEEARAILYASVGRLAPPATPSSDPR